MRILMVCLGNICRSPLAEGILSHKAEQAGLNWEIDSAGTGGWHVGNLPDTRSISVAKNHGIDLTTQRARKFQLEDFNSFDQIFVMDQQNYRTLRAMTSNKSDLEKVQLILNMVSPDEHLEVPDPYHDDDGFEAVFQMLDKACSKIIQKYA